MALHVMFKKWHCADFKGVHLCMWVSGSNSKSVGGKGAKQGVEKEVGGGSAQVATCLVVALLSQWLFEAPMVIFHLLVPIPKDYPLDIAKGLDCIE